MVSPTKPGPIGTPGYSSVPNPEGSPTVDQFQSPDPNRSSAAYNDLSGNNLPESSLLSPEAAETSMLRPDSGIYPAASIMSRDSSLPGTPQPDNRSSWGSAAALNVGADVSLARLVRFTMLWLTDLGTSKDHPWAICSAPFYRRRGACVV